MTDQNDSKKHWILVEGPRPGDAQFLGQWLLAAAKADKLLQEQFEIDPDFKRAVDRLEGVYGFAFSPTATKCIEFLMTDLTAFPLSVFDEPWGEVFVVMAELGFFTETSDRYQMTIPKDPSSEEIKAALLHLANTEDEKLFSTSRASNSLPVPVRRSGLASAPQPYSLPSKSGRSSHSVRRRRRLRQMGTITRTTERPWRAAIPAFRDGPAFGSWRGRARPSGRNSSSVIRALFGLQINSQAKMLIGQTDGGGTNRPCRGLVPTCHVTASFGTAQKDDRLYEGDWSIPLGLDENVGYCGAACIGHRDSIPTSTRDPIRPPAPASRLNL